MQLPLDRVRNWRLNCNKLDSVTIWLKLFYFLAKRNKITLLGNQDTIQLVMHRVEWCCFNLVLYDSALTFGMHMWLYACLVLQLRHVMDPKRHFKRAGKSKALPRYFQVSNLVTIRQTYSTFFIIIFCWKVHVSSSVTDVLNISMLVLGWYSCWASIWVLLR